MAKEKHFKPKIISYRLRSDSGFAPNPFHNVLTLATCKSRIRRVEAHVGDWLFGFVGTELQEKVKRKYGTCIEECALLYAAEISEILPYHEYFSKYPEKRVKFDGTMIEQAGDNIYCKDSNDPDNSYKQLKNKNHDDSYYIKDTGGKNTLICKKFYYFGKEGKLLDNQISDKIAVPRGRGDPHTRENVEEIIEKLLKWIELKYDNKKGQIGLPCLWDEDENTQYKCKSKC